MIPANLLGTPVLPINKMHMVLMHTELTARGGDSPIDPPESVTVAQRRGS